MSNLIDTCDLGRCQTSGNMIRLIRDLISPSSPHCPFALEPRPRCRCRPRTSSTLKPRSRSASKYLTTPVCGVLYCSTPFSFFPFPNGLVEELTSVAPDNPPDFCRWIWYVDLTSVGPLPLRAV